MVVVGASVVPLTLAQKEELGERLLGRRLRLHCSWGESAGEGRGVWLLLLPLGRGRAAPGRPPLALAYQPGMAG